MNTSCSRAVGVALVLFLAGCREQTCAEDCPGGGVTDAGEDADSPARAPARYLRHSFEKTVLNREFRAEGATFADLDRDGHNDLIAGSFWYRGPSFDQKFSYYDGGVFDGATTYSDNFFAFAEDFDADGWTDILIVGFPGRATHWYRNPGGDAPDAGAAAWPAWQPHLALATTDNESPAFTDLTGDGKRELVCIHQGDYGYATPVAGNPSAPWTFHRLSNDGGRGNFTHGMGVGDVDGDGRQDLLERSGWWRQPGSLDGDPVWQKHAFEFSPWGGAQMFAFDVDGDGDQDVVSSLAAHEFGLSWFEHVKMGTTNTFTPHVIMGARPEDNPYGVRFGELHALDLIDMDGDGLRDIVTGKRFWSHGPAGDPEGLDAAAVLYWFRLERTPAGARFVPHLIDGDSGVGTQVVAGDVRGDGFPDVVVSNKKGTFFLSHTAREVTRDEWLAGQPPLRP